MPKIARAPRAIAFRKRCLKKLRALTSCAANFAKVCHHKIATLGCSRTLLFRFHDEQAREAPMLNNAPPRKQSVHAV